MAVKVKGLDKVLRNLKKETDKIKGRSLKGLIKASILVRSDTEKTSPKIPVDTSNLRASYFTVTSKGSTTEGGSPQFKGDDSEKLSSGHNEVVNDAKSLVRGREPGLALGFSAFYAWYVHEAIDNKFLRPGSGPKFLEAALNRNRKRVLKVIADEAKIK